MKIKALAVMESFDSASLPTREGTSQRLGRRAAASLAARKGATLSCLAGSIWVTKKGDPADYLLAAGESLPLDADLVLEGLEDSDYRVA